MQFFLATDSRHFCPVLALSFACNVAWSADGRHLCPVLALFFACNVAWSADGRHLCRVLTLWAGNATWNTEVRQLREQLALQSAREMATDTGRKRAWTTGCASDTTWQSEDPSTSSSYDSASNVIQAAIFQVKISPASSMLARS